MPSEDNVRIKWYRTPIDKKVLSELTARSDIKGFCHVVPLFILSIVTGVLAYYAYLNWPWWAVIAACYLHATFFHFLGLSGPGHELCHSTVFKSRFWNAFFLRISCFLNWINFEFFIVSHHRHHQVTVHHGLDLEVVMPIRLRMIDILMAFTVNPYKFYLVVRGTARLCMGYFDGPWAQRIFPEADREARGKVVRWARILLFGHIALATLFIYSGNWFLLFLVTLPPFYAEWLNFLCAQTQHICLMPDVDDYRLCCRSVKLNPFLSFLYCNMNYHTEHHMYAAVPCYNLPKLRKTIEHDLPAAKAGLWQAWREIIPAVREQRRNPDYVLVNRLPDQIV